MATIAEQLTKLNSLKTQLAANLTTKGVTATATETFNTLLQSLQTDGILYFEGLEEDFAAEVALTIDEQEDDVRATIGYLLRVGKLEKKTEWEYVIPDAVKSIGSETAVAERVRRCRANKKQSEALQCNTTETQVKQNGNGEIDIDREIEKDIYLSILDGESKENLSTFQSLCS